MTDPYVRHEVADEAYVDDGPADRGRISRIAGFLVSLLGILLAALSILSMAWMQNPKRTFGDLHDGVRQMNELPPGSDWLDHLSFRYFQFGGYVALALVAVLLAVVGVTLMSRDNPPMRAVTAFFAALAAIVHAVVVAHIDGSKELGAWLGTVGYVIVIVGLVIAGSRVYSQRRVVRERVVR